MKKATSISIGHAHVARAAHGRGARAITKVDLESGGWRGRYLISAETPAEAVAQRNRWIEHHEKKAERLSGFTAPAFRRPIRASGGEEFTLRDCTLLEQGTDVVLLVRIADEEGRDIEWRGFYRDVALVPTDAEIREKMAEIATTQRREVEEADAFRRAVQAALNGEGVSL